MNYAEKRAAFARSLAIWIRQDDVGLDFIIERLAEYDHHRIPDSAIDRKDYKDVFEMGVRRCVKLRAENERLVREKNNLQHDSNLLSYIATFWDSQAKGKQPLLGGRFIANHDGSFRDAILRDMVYYDKIPTRSHCRSLLRFYWHRECNRPWTYWVRGAALAFRREIMGEEVRALREPREWDGYDFVADHARVIDGTITALLLGAVIICYWLAFPNS